MIRVLVLVVLLTGCTATVSGTAAPDATAACAGAEVTDDGIDLATALPTAGPSTVAPDPARTGPVTLEGLLAHQPSDEAKAALRGGLTGAGFRDAYQRGWKGGAAGTGDYRSQLLVVYHFATPQGACRFLAGEAERFRLAPKDVPGVPGAVAVSARDAFWSATAEAAKGTYVIEASAVSFVAPVEPWTTDLLRAAYGML